MKTPSIRFGTLYQLDITPRDKALHDPDQVCLNMKVQGAVLRAEQQQTGRRHHPNPITLFLQGKFYALAGKTKEEFHKQEELYTQTLPKIEQFVLQHARTEEQVTELLGKERLADIKAGLEQRINILVDQKLQTETCPTLTIDLDA